MTLTFLNGGSPNYLGYQFTTATDLIDTIETNLVAAGWTSLTKVSGTSLFIRGVTAVNSHNCWMEFTVTGSAPNLTLNLQGWKEAAKTNGSGTNYTLTFITSTSNSLWLTAESDSFCISILDSALNQQGHHFGFTQRIDETDTFAIYIGAIKTHFARLTAPAYRVRVAEHKIQGTNWATFNNRISFEGAGALTTDFIQLGTLDFMVRYAAQVSGATSNAVALGLSSQFGALNYANNKYLIDDYYYVEARGSTTFISTTYGNFDGNSATRGLTYRGIIKNAATGGAGLSKAFQILDTDGKRYLSCGDATEGWQLMRIL